MKGLHDVVGVAELVVSEDDLLEILGDTDTTQDLGDTLISELVALEVDFFQGRSSVDHDLEKCVGALSIDAAVSQ